MSNFLLSNKVSDTNLESYHPQAEGSKYKKICDKLKTPLLLIALLILAPCLLAATQTPETPPAETPVENKKITPLQAVILGVVEGLTEYLPVSSTGHLIIVNHAMGNTKFSKGKEGIFGPKLENAGNTGSFEIVIQLGAILAVIGLYRIRIKQMAKGILRRDKRGLRLLMLLLVGFAPAAVVGLWLHEPIKSNLFNPIPVCWALVGGGVFMIVIEKFNKSKYSLRPQVHIETMLFSQALIIGFAQCLAMWPGTSRSMITIIAALLVGLDLATAAEFSFLLALPTLGAATIYESTTQWNELMSSAGPLSLIIGTVTSMIVAVIAVKLFVKYLTRWGLTPFGIYRILLAGVVALYFFLN